MDLKIIITRFIRDLPLIGQKLVDRETNKEKFCELCVN